MEPRAAFDTLPSQAPSKMGLEEVFSSFRTSPEGISDAEASARFSAFGPNELVAKRVGGWDVFRRQFGSPMIYLLAAAAIVSLGLQEWIDGLTILVMLSVNTGIGFFQEYRSERALEKLKERLAPRTRVRRGGDVVEIDRRRLVPGDIVFATGTLFLAAFALRLLKGQAAPANSHASARVHVRNA